MGGRSDSQQPIRAGDGELEELESLIAELRTELAESDAEIDELEGEIERAVETLEVEAAAEPEPPQPVAPPQPEPTPETEPEPIAAESSAEAPSEPEPALEAPVEPTPEPVLATPSEPEPVVEAPAPVEPEPVVAVASEPEPVVEAPAEPEPALDEVEAAPEPMAAAAPDPVPEESLQTEPQPEVPAPEPAILETPALPPAPEVPLAAAVPEPAPVESLSEPELPPPPPPEPERSWVRVSSAAEPWTPIQVDAEPQEIEPPRIEAPPPPAPILPREPLSAPSLPFTAPRPFAPARPELDPSGVEIRRHWERNQLDARLTASGLSGLDDFLVGQCFREFRRQPEQLVDVVSLGAGDCAFEVELACRAQEAGITNFHIHCLENDPFGLARGRRLASDRGATDRLSFVDHNLERPISDRSVGVCLIQGSLSRAEHPQTVLAEIRSALQPDSLLLIRDQLLPATALCTPDNLDVINRIWPLLPERYRYDHLTESVCARFEPNPQEAGVRENLLQLLRENFEFEVFLAYGGLLECFSGPRFGPNFDPQSQRDRWLIDRLARVGDAQIDAGLMPPTRAIASLRLRTQSSVWAYRHWTPDYCAGIPLA